MIKRVIIAITLLSLALGAAAAGYRTGSRQTLPGRGVPFTLRARSTEFLPDGSERVLEETRFESSNGDVHTRKTRDGSVVFESFFVQGRGHFVVNRLRGVLLRSDRTSRTRDALAGASDEVLRASPQFDRTEMLLGRMAYVMRVTDPATRALAGETWVIPEFGNQPLKLTAYNLHTGRLALRYEPVEITNGEPSAANLRPPDLPEEAAKEPGQLDGLNLLP